MFFINAGKGAHHWWLFVAGALVVSLGYIIGQIPMSLVLTYKISKDPALDSSDLIEFSENLDFEKFGISTNFGLVLSLLIFVTALAFLYFVVFVFHKRNFTSLINYVERVDWKRFFWGFGVWFSISLFMEIISYYLSPENYEYVAPGREYFLLLLICVIMLPLQTSFEELFFRGYLMQTIGYHTRSKWLAMLVISFLFMSIHLANPEIEQYGTINMVIYYFASGLILAFITIMDDRLELAMGIHFANNFFGATLVTYEGAALRTNSLYKVHEINPQMMVIGFALVAVVFMVLASRRFHWQSIGKSFKWVDPIIKTL
ncbi:MAG TPA: CPBP family intramembrane metalloprotease [Saprospiraceae bacterium]|nr:CPBP family intramembrane metalloprotease [Saprospiraceae bacterium]